MTSGSPNIEIGAAVASRLAVPLAGRERPASAAAEGAKQLVAAEAASRRWALGAFALVALIHVWIVSAGWMTYWPQYTNNYSLLADAFLHGQLHLRIQPAPALLALPDPYDPVANRYLRVHDMSLYRGHYYLYWGPVPAILEMPIVAITGHPIGDQFLVFAFVLGIVAISGLLLLRIRGEIFPNAPPWTVAMGVLLAGLAMPIPFLLSRAATYEAAIAGGQFFLLTGIYFALCGKENARKLAFAGICWGLAVGCRSSLAPAVVGATLLLAGWRLASPPSRGRRTLTTARSLTALAIPLLIGAALLATYNRARFDRATEFGAHYELAGYDVQKVNLFSVGNVLPALYSYSIKPPAIIRSFPFLQAQGGGQTLPSFIHLPDGYWAQEPVAGIFWCCPFLLLALLPIRRLLRGVGYAHLANEARWRWLSVLLTSTSILAILPALFVLGCTMRYLADFTPTLLIAAMMGLWQRPGGRWLAIGATLAGWTTCVGFLLAIIGNYGHFPHFHPGYLGL